MQINAKSGVGIILTAMLLVSMAFVPTVSAQANENVGVKAENIDFSIEKEYGKLFLEKMGYSAELTSSIPLKNLEGNVEAVAFSVNNEGYIIINVNDLSVPEYSMTSENPFVDKNKNYYYNGPLAYVEGELKSERIKTAYIYKKERVNKSKRLSELKKIFMETSNVQLLSGASGILSHSLRTWEDNNIYCGPIAAGINLIYLDDYLDNDFVASGYENQNDLLDFITNGYIDNSGTYAWQLRNGLNSYIEDRNLANEYSAYAIAFDYSKLMSLIDDDKPVDVSTNNHPTFDDHWIIAHGYFVQDVPYVVPQPYIVVNNGWGDNNINVLVGDYLINQVWIE
ncbi:hypothetical protein C7960_1298 [Methanohalophilus euhalobius]|jgi:hypothetical protein|uniref:Peptidase C39-like domain-containing protein n=1 Tax=Methanohalophilus euhalobius TaxID=51203 RepID=A0A285GEN8_9EURY|nr:MULTISPECIES: hypothetical protein [Methanohalophilus]OBZ34740.1 MAG: hypothetical protein A9957_02250 [Methanohalophilus sp. DAL1]ODV50177.1 MAG: hypothetical protein A8273_483 [Methanohalophilus sp. 2-GBenrich]RXG34468.1 hypothetical protein CI957_906 [Methanohalophilus sp. WG1-DM]TCL12085.1 hypothetical protein C7960_1298 [Methanohalophilus euhalobius]SNY20956.1 hypothetical protein SAMN06295989_11226 [Methanohalophilus euhalobius]